MTRGRKKDLTIPTSRSLAQQRDYRARKAQYVADLERRCKMAEDENERLRKELEMVREGVPGLSTSNPEMAQASAELMQQLGATSEALLRFQQLAFAGVSRPAQYRSPQDNINSVLRPAHFLSEPHAPTSLPSISPPPRFHSNYKRLFSEAFSRPANSSRSDSSRSHTPEPPPQGRSTSPDRDITGHNSDVESECCGGFVDCDAQCE